ncbi:MAG: SH3 domain-containing protein, partial [Oscillospiraceae bacterium]
ARIETVRTSGGNLNIRSKPSAAASVKGSIPNGSQVDVYSRIGDWYVIGKDGIVGYVFAKYIQ